MRNGLLSLRKRKNSYGVWSVLYLAAVCVSAWCLTGCGGEHGQAGVSESVSGSAVSGQAVSGGALSVSGQAVSGGALSVSGQVVSGGAIRELHKDVSEKFTYCSDRHLYYVSDDNELIERDRKDGSERKVRVGEKDDDVGGGIELSYVDNDWVYWEKAYSSVLRIWRAPIRKEKQWQLDGTATELVFEEKIENLTFGVGARLWCDGEYIVYNYESDLISEYREYNIRNKSFETSVLPPINFRWTDSYSYYKILAVNHGYAVVTDQNKTFLKKIGSGESDAVNVICDIDEDSDEWTNDGVLLGEQGFFWAKMGNNGKFLEIWRYEPEGGKERLAEGSQIRKILKDGGVLNCQSREKHTIEACGKFIRDGRIYVQLQIEGDEDGVICKNMAIISISLDGSGEMRVEKTLTDYLKNPKENQKVFEKNQRHAPSEACIYRSRGMCVSMTEEICLMYLENREKKENGYACYNFSTGKFQWLTEKDAEWWVRYYDYFNIFPGDHYEKSDFFMRNAMMPNNYDF